MLLYRLTTPTGPWSLRETELPNTGIYSDTADNDTTYYYRYTARDADGHGSAVIGTSPATPSEDPFPPEAYVQIDEGAAMTPDLDVLLSFVPAGEDAEDLELFVDIQEMKLSNDPLLAGAGYQPFAQDVPWVLPATAPGEIAKVYAQFKDDAGNESLIVLDAIIVEGGTTSEFDTEICRPNVQR